MSKIVDIQAVRHLRAAATSLCANAPDGKEGGDARYANQQLNVKEEIFRSILLLDLGAQHARLLMEQISDQSRRRIFEAQIATIEQLLQIVRQKALKL